MNDVLFLCFFFTPTSSSFLKENSCFLLRLVTMIIVARLVYNEVNIDKTGNRGRCKTGKRSDKAKIGNSGNTYKR